MRRIEQIVRRNDRLKPAIKHDAHAIRKLLRFVEIMRDEHDRAIEIPMHHAQQIVHARLRRGIERRERLVQNKKTGPQHERAQARRAAIRRR